MAWFVKLPCFRPSVSARRRGLRGMEYVVSDDHSGLRAVRRAVLGGAALKQRKR